MKQLRTTSVFLALLSSVTPAQNPGSGPFDFEVTHYPIPGAPPKLAVGDLNQDGVDDLALMVRLPGELVLMLNDGAAHFTLLKRFKTQSEPTDLQVADVDGDGIQDLVVLRGTAGFFSIYPGLGGGLFGEPIDYATNPSLGQTNELLLGHFNDDDRLDLVVADNSSVSVHFGRPASFGPTGPGPGQPYLQLGHSVAPPGFALFGPEDLRFQGFSVAHLSCADVNGDGRDDIAVGEQYEFVLHVLLADGRGGFELVTDHGWSAAPTWATFADVDGDGILDAISPTFDFETTPELQFGLGDGSFSGAHILSCSAFVLWWNETQDFNGDGRFDNAFVAKSSYGSLGLIDDLRTATYKFPPYNVALGAPVIRDGASSDFDGDGKPDLVVTLPGPGTFAVLRNVSPVPPPTLLAATPPALYSVALGGQTLELEGIALKDATQVSIGGIALEPDDYDASDPLYMLLQVPLLAQTRSVQVRVTTASGTASLQIDVQAPPEPILDLNGAGAEVALSTAEIVRLTLGAKPGDAYFLLASVSAAPSLLPGIVDLSIGNNFANLLQLASGFVGPAAWSQVSLPLDSLPVGATLHFQAAVLEADDYTLPMTSSNAAALLITAALR